MPTIGGVLPTESQGPASDNATNADVLEEDLLVSVAANDPSAEEPSCPISV